MNIIKIIAGLLVAAPMAVFAFVGVATVPAFTNVALAGYGQDKNKVCHNGKTISVSSAAMPAHLAHLDTPGRCPADDNRGRDHNEDNDINDDDINDDDAPGSEDRHGSNRR